MRMSRQRCLSQRILKLLIEGMTEGGMITSWTASRGQLRVGEVLLEGRVRVADAICGVWGLSN